MRLGYSFVRSNFKLKTLQFRHPRESGDPFKCLIKMGSRLRGNDGNDGIDGFLG